LREEGTKCRHALSHVRLEADTKPVMGVIQAADTTLVDATKVAGVTLDATKEEEETTMQGVLMEEVATQGAMILAGEATEDDTTVARPGKEIDTVRTTTVEGTMLMTAVVDQGVTM